MHINEVTMTMAVTYMSYCASLLVITGLGQQGHG